MFEDQFGIKSVAMEKDCHYSPSWRTGHFMHLFIVGAAGDQRPIIRYDQLGSGRSDVQMIYPFGKWIGLLKNCMSFVKS